MFVSDGWVPIIHEPRFPAERWSKAHGTSAVPQNPSQFLRGLKSREVRRVFGQSTGLKSN